MSDYRTNAPPESTLGYNPPNVIPKVKQKKSPFVVNHQIVDHSGSESGTGFVGRQAPKRKVNFGGDISNQSIHSLEYRSQIDAAHLYTLDKSFE